MISNILKSIKVFLTKKITFDIDLIPLNYERVPYRKILNWVLTEGSVPIKPDKPWGLPTILQVEPTNYCDLQCRVCPVTRGMNRRSGHMDPRLFKKIIDELADYLFLILFWDWGKTPMLPGKSPPEDCCWRTAGPLHRLG